MYTHTAGRFFSLPQSSGSLRSSTFQLLNTPTTRNFSNFSKLNEKTFSFAKATRYGSQPISRTNMGPKLGQQSSIKKENDTSLQDSMVRLFQTLVRVGISNPGIVPKPNKIFSSAGVLSKDARRFIQIAQDAGASATAPPTKPPRSEIDNKRLEDLKKQAEESPSDPTKQFYYVQELNRLGEYQATLDHCANNKFAIDDSIRREHVKALVYLNKFDASSLSLFSSAPGASPERPLYTNPISNESKWTSGFRNLSYLFSIILGIVIVYALLFGKTSGGGLGELMNSNINAVDTQVTTTLNDVKGNEEAKEELSDIVEYLKNPHKFSHMGAKLPKGILLVGPPGCGKTLVAKALAGEAGVPFYYTSGSEFEEMLVGVGARRVRALFNKAKESSPCIIFIDEIDALGAKRDSIDTRSSKMSLNQLLVELDGFAPSTGVVVIAATNMPETLDPALTRPGRFDRQVTVDLPDVKARKEIIDMYLGNKRSSDVNLDELAKATVGFSGAELFNMVNTALIQAVKRNMFKVNNSMLISAKETVQMGPERKSLTLTPETKSITAYHEAGHALISLFHQKPIVKATLVPRGHALGMVSYLPKDVMLTKKEDLLGHLETAMGGRIAEELIFGAEKVTQGAGSDFKQATRLAYTMVASYGMSEKLGHFSFSERELQTLSQDTRAAIDTEVKNLLDNAYDKAKKTLITHKPQLVALAQALLEFETLTEEEVKMAVEGKDLRGFRETKAKLEEELKKPPPSVKPLSVGDLGDAPSVPTVIPPPKPALG